ncbi:MAG: cytochrome c biogenesis CcdA family protein [Halodesulfurarchaeum sp.]
MGVLDVTAVAAAFSMGIASFFAPCAFPLLPGYVGYYVGSVEAEVPFRGAVARGVAAGIGALAVIGGVAVLVATAGRMLVTQLRYVEPIIGLALLVLGALMVLDRVPSWHVSLPGRRTSILGFGLFGAGYALAASGCFAPVFVAVILEALTLSVVGGFLAVLAFATGMAGLLIAATVAIAIGHDLGGSTLPRYAERITPIAGVVVMIAGAYQLVEAARLLGWV